MFTRSKDIEQGTVSATIQWDNGDPSVGIAAGLGEETGIEYQVEGWTAYLTWRDYDYTRKQPIREVENWIVDTFELATGPADMSARVPTFLALIRGRIHSRILRLSELPEALEVVSVAWGDYIASERLLGAQESLWLVSTELDSVLWDAQEHQGLEGIALLNKLDELREAEKRAEREVEIATIIYRDQFGIRDYNNMRGW